MWAVTAGASWAHGPSGAARPHLAFEPLPQLAVELRRAARGDVHETALSDRAGEPSSLSCQRIGYSGLRERTYPAQWRTELIRVRTERLDDIPPEDCAPDFIKIDVEGAERLVFEGAIEIIARHRPVIVFEHGLGGSDRYRRHTRDGLEPPIETADLRLFDLDAEGPFSRDQFAEIYASGRIWDFLARS